LAQLLTSSRKIFENIIELDFRFTHKPIVRIALEHLLAILLRTTIVLGLYLSLSGSVCFSFDAVEYDSATPMETMVSSSFKSRGRRPSVSLSAKNAKNLHGSEKNLNLNEMSKYFNVNLSAKGQFKKTPSTTPVRNLPTLGSGLR